MPTGSQRFPSAIWWSMLAPRGAGTAVGQVPTAPRPRCVPPSRHLLLRTCEICADDTLKFPPTIADSRTQASRAVMERERRFTSAESPESSTAKGVNPRCRFCSSLRYEELRCCTGLRELFSIKESDRAGADEPLSCVFARGQLARVVRTVVHGLFPCFSKRLRRYSHGCSGRCGLCSNTTDGNAMPAFSACVKKERGCCAGRGSGPAIIPVAPRESESPNGHTSAPLIAFAITAGNAR